MDEIQNTVVLFPWKLFYGYPQSYPQGKRDLRHRVVTLPTCQSAR